MWIISKRTQASAIQDKNRQKLIEKIVWGSHRLNLFGGCDEDDSKGSQANTTRRRPGGEQMADADSNEDAIYQIIWVILAFLKNNFNGVDRKNNFLSTGFSSDGVSVI